MKTLRRVLVLLGLGFCFHAPLSANDLAGLDLTKLLASEEYMLPSPSVLMQAAQSRGFKVKVKSHLGVFGVDLEKRAQISRVETAFYIGRMMAVAGLIYEDLNNESILQISKKLFEGLLVLGLPKSVADELDRNYREFRQSPKKSRQEILVYFAEVRSSLLSLLKDQRDQSLPDREKLHIMAISMEAGIWFQSLSLFLDNAKSSEDLNTVREVFMLSDIIKHFKRQLVKPLKHFKGTLLLRELNHMNLKIESFVADNKLSADEAEALRKVLARLIL